MGVRGIALGDGDKVISLSILRHVDVTAEERAAYLKRASAVRRSAGEPEEGTADAEEANGAIELGEKRYVELSAAEQFVLTVSERGFGKRSSSYQYRTTGRGGKGIVAMDIREKDGTIKKKIGRLVASFPVEESDQIMLVTNGGQLIRCPINGIRIAGRGTQGVIVFDTAEDERVVSVERLSEEDRQRRTARNRRKAGYQLRPGRREPHRYAAAAARELDRHQSRPRRPRELASGLVPLPRRLHPARRCARDPTRHCVLRRLFWPSPGAVLTVATTSSGTSPLSSSIAFCRLASRFAAFSVSARLSALLRRFRFLRGVGKGVHRPRSPARLRPLPAAASRIRRQDLTCPRRIAACSLRIGSAPDRGVIGAGTVRSRLRRRLRRRLAWPASQAPAAAAVSAQRGLLRARRPFSACGGGSAHRRSGRSDRLVAGRRRACGCGCRLRLDDRLRRHCRHRVAFVGDDADLARAARRFDALRATLVDIRPGLLVAERLVPPRRFRASARSRCARGCSRVL